MRVSCIYNFRAGYFCFSGAKIPNPHDETGWPCSLGHYCPSGTQSEIDCIEGTFFDYTHAEDVNDCQNIKPGMYSIISGATSDVLDDGDGQGKCSAGYVCYGGSYTPSPSNKILGDICPIGSYCPEGSHTPMDCPVGTYSDVTGLGQCKPCTAGKYCPDIGMTVTQDCPIHNWCPQNSTLPTPCPPGTYSTKLGLSDESSCPLCGSGSACENPATATETKCAN